MRNFYLSTLLILVCFGAMAQSDYIITTKTDTIRGDVRILSYDKLDRAQISNKGKKEMYTALQILTLFMDSAFYKPIQKDNTIRLMKVLKSGYLSLYAYNLPNQATFDGRYLVKLDGTTMEMPNLSFKKIMANYLADCESLAAKIKKGEMGKSDVNAIIDEYNICVTQLKPAVKPTSEELLAIQSLTTKIQELNFEAKEDALDILRDMQSKIEKNEKVSKYLIEGLETALKDQATVSEDLNKLMSLLKK